jgi:hypothetical protein
MPFCVRRRLICKAVYRVHWLRTKALRDRWAEELLLVQHEMEWTYNFFLHKAEVWVVHMRDAKADGLEGRRCYAARQGNMYRLLGQHAHVSFNKVKAP